MSKSSCCILGSLDNPFLNGLTLGLEFKNEDLVQLKHDMFPCCQAQGMTYDEGLGGTRTCTLKPRLLRVKRLMAQYKSVWPDVVRSPQQISGPASSLVLQELASVIRRDKPEAQISFAAQKNQPSVVWSKALAAIWRFGIDARVFNLVKSNSRDLAAFTGDHKGPLALFVEQIDKLWDPLHAETLEHIVQRAYNGSAFLWLEFTQQHQQLELEKESDLDLNAEFTRRIARKKKAKHPFESLSHDCISRLQSMSNQVLNNSHGAKHV